MGCDPQQYLAFSLVEVDTVICVVTPNPSDQYQMTIQMTTRTAQRKRLIPLLYGVDQEEYQELIKTPFMWGLTLHLPTTYTDPDCLENIVKVLKIPDLGMYNNDNNI